MVAVARPDTSCVGRSARRRHQAGRRRRVRRQEHAGLPGGHARRVRNRRDQRCGELAPRPGGAGLRARRQRRADRVRWSRVKGRCRRYPGEAAESRAHRHSGRRRRRVRSHVECGDTDRSTKRRQTRGSRFPHLHVRHNGFPQGRDDQPPGRGGAFGKRRGRIPISGRRPQPRGHADVPRWRHQLRVARYPPGRAEHHPALGRRPRPDQCDRRWCDTHVPGSCGYRGHPQRRRAGDRRVLAAEVDRVRGIAVPGAGPERRTGQLAERQLHPGVRHDRTRRCPWRH